MDAPDFQKAIDEIRECREAVYYRTVNSPRGVISVEECQEIMRYKRDATHDIVDQDFVSEAAAYEWLGRMFCVASRLGK